MGDDQRVDRFLRQRVAGAPLGDRDALRGGRREIENAGIDQPVMHHHIGRFQSLDGTQGQQSGIAGTGAHQYHAAARIGIEQGSHAWQMVDCRTKRNRALLAQALG